MANLKYSDKLKYIRPYTKLGINKNASFTPQEKRLIAKYFNLLEKEGVIRKENGKFINTVKFVKSTKKQSKGSPKFTGYFIKGAKPSDKINKQGQIITDHYIKTFIPANFSSALVEDEEEGDQIDEDTIYQILVEVLTPYYEELKGSDYLTLVLENGFEIGRGKFTNPNEKTGQALTKGLSKAKKIDELVYEIAKILRKSVDKYKIAENLLKGLYLWKFINQKKPSKKTSKIIKKGKKK